MRLLGEQPRIGDPIFAVVITHDMGVARIDAANGPVDDLGTDREGHAVAGMPRGTQEVRPALHVLPRRPHIAGEQPVWDTQLGALVRHDVGRRAPLSGHMACHRAVPVPKGHPLSNLHLLGRRGMSLSVAEATNGGSAKVWQPCTPAMAAGLTDHVWSLTEVLCYRVPPCPQPQTV
jgi:hypothetical protein